LSYFVEEAVVEMGVIRDLMNFLEGLCETVCFVLGGAKCLVLVYEVVVLMFFLSGDLLESGPEALTVAVI
jgi:hypothetical protein